MPWNYMENLSSVFYVLFKIISLLKNFSVQGSVALYIIIFTIIIIIIIIIIILVIFIFNTEIMINQFIIKIY
jgi:hypothetical protein